MTNATTVFDAVRFKQTTRAQWQDAADAWYRWGDLLTRWLGPATEVMLDLAGVTEGSHVLDVAAGAGEQTLTAARRVGPAGRVLATDIAPNVLRFAHESARKAGFENVETREMDGERTGDLPEASFDAVISRVGLIYFPDQQRALRGILDVLKPGGKFCAMVYATAERNGFFSLPVSIIRNRAKLPAPQPGRPGPFSLGDMPTLRDTMVKAGFRDVGVRLIDAPVRLESAAECLAFERESFGALHQMMGSLSDAEREETWNDIEAALRRFEGPDGFTGPCELSLAWGTK